MSTIAAIVVEMYNIGNIVILCMCIVLSIQLISNGNNPKKPKGLQIFRLNVLIRVICGVNITTYDLIECIVLSIVTNE